MASQVVEPRAVRRLAGRTAPRPLSSYADLAATVQAAGLMSRRRGWYVRRTGATAAAFAGVWAAFAVLGDSWWQLLPAAVLGVVVTQFAFLGHDGAHRQIVASCRGNEWTGRVFAGLFAGLSFAWWMSKHTRHHGAPNQEGKDPDIRGGGAVAFTPAVAAARRGLSARLVAVQGWYFFPLLLLEAANLHVASYRSVLGAGAVRRRGLDLLLMTTRWVVYLSVVGAVLPAGKAVAFVAVQLAVTGVCLGGAFAPNHTGMPVVPADGRIDFLRRQVLMSRTISGGWWVDLFMGGLNRQVEHHLFPSMPRPNLAAAQPLVRAFCAEHAIPYTETTLGGSYRIIVRYLNRVGIAHADPFTCPLLARSRS